MPLFFHCLLTSRLLMSLSSVCEQDGHALLEWSGAAKEDERVFYLSDASYPQRVFFFVTSV